MHHIGISGLGASSQMAKKKGKPDHIDDEPAYAGPQYPASFGARYCAACGARYGTYSMVCPECHQDAATFHLAGATVAKAKVAPAHALQPPLAPLAVPAGVIGVLHGPYGAGKTTALLTACAPALWLSTEMEAAQLNAYAARLGARIGHYVDLRDIPIEELHRLDLSHLRVGGVVLDSYSAYRGDADQLAGWIKPLAELLGVPIFLVLHERKDGQMAGGHQIPYLAEVVIRKTQWGLHVRKNRYGPSFSHQGSLDPNTYYTARRVGGEVRLIPWPLETRSRHRWDELLRVVERGDSELGDLLPPAPCVCVGVRTRLSPKGWHVPQEVIAHCQALSVPYWYPGVADAA